MKLWKFALAYIVCAVALTAGIFVLLSAAWAWLAPVLRANGVKGI